MKAAHPLFKPFFRFFLWQERLSTGTMIGLWIGAVVVIRVLWRGVGGAVGAVALGLWLAFVASTWAAEPLANLTLRTSRIGRAILPADQKRSSSTFALLIAGAVVCAVLVLVNGAFVEAAFVLVFLAFAAGRLHGVSAERGRLLNRAIVTIALAAFVGPLLVAAGVEVVGALLMISSFLAAVVLLWVVRLS